MRVLMKNKKKTNGNTDPSKNRRILRPGQPDRADDRMIFIPSAENHCTCIIITYVVEFCFYSSSVVDLKVNVKVIYFTIHDREAIVLTSTHRIIEDTSMCYGRSVSPAIIYVTCYER
jgi:hypothetical protein